MPTLSPISASIPPGPPAPPVEPEPSLPLSDKALAIEIEFRLSSAREREPTMLTVTVEPMLTTVPVKTATHRRHDPPLPKTDTPLKVAAPVIARVSVLIVIDPLLTFRVFPTGLKRENGLIERPGQPAPDWASVSSTVATLAALIITCCFLIDLPMSSPCSRRNAKGLAVVREICKGTEAAGSAIASFYKIF